MRRIRVAPLSALPPGARLALEVEGLALAVFNIDGTLRAFENRCPHQFAPLDDGELRGTRLSCRWHGWTFELDPAKQGPLAIPRVACYAVEVEAGDVYVVIPEAADRTSGGSSPGASIQESGPSARSSPGSPIP